MTVTRGARETYKPITIFDGLKVEIFVVLQFSIFLSSLTSVQVEVLVFFTQDTSYFAAKTMEKLAETHAVIVCYFICVKEVRRVMTFMQQVMSRFDV